MDYNHNKGCQLLIVGALSSKRVSRSSMVLRRLCIASISPCVACVLAISLRAVSIIVNRLSISENLRSKYLWRMASSTSDMVSTIDSKVIHFVYYYPCFMIKDFITTYSQHDPLQLSIVGFWFPEIRMEFVNSLVGVLVRTRRDPAVFRNRLLHAFLWLLHAFFPHGELRRRRTDKWGNSTIATGGAVQYPYCTLRTVQFWSCRYHNTLMHLSQMLNCYTTMHLCVYNVNNKRMTCHG